MSHNVHFSNQMDPASKAIITGLTPEQRAKIRDVIVTYADMYNQEADLTRIGHTGHRFTVDATSFDVFFRPTGPIPEQSGYFVLTIYRVTH